MVSRRSCPATPTTCLRRRQRPTSISWTRARSQEALWISTNWRGLISCCRSRVPNPNSYCRRVNEGFPMMPSLSPLLCRPLERGWRKAKDGSLLQPKVRLKQEVVSVSSRQRGQRIAVPVKRLFAREKRPYGLGMVGRLTNRTYRKRLDSFVQRQIEDMDAHRQELRFGFCFLKAASCTTQ